MIRNTERTRYALGAAALLLLAAGLVAAALGAPPAHPDGLPPHPAAVGTLTPLHRAFAPAPTPSGTSHPPSPVGARSALTAARERLRKGARGPASEVDRWAVHLATDRAASHAALDRFSLYRSLIEETLYKYGLPRELAFLPWVESEWLNDARSSAGAGGMWQFMPTTGRGYGLEVSNYVDERRDPIRATDAAARHLVDLFRATGDWHAALAAYNAGLGRARHTSGAFWRRRHSLPAETRAYVPRVLAAAQVGRDPQAWGLDPAGRPPLRFREVQVPGGISLDAVARGMGAPPSAVRELNPHLVRGMTPPGRPWRVRVPSPQITTQRVDRR